MPGTTDPKEAGRGRSTAQERSRAQTQTRLLQAADELFLDRGYAATTVSAIATRAEVSLQTLYLAWGSKRALFSAAADAATTATDLPPVPQRWHQSLEEQIACLAGEDATAQAYIEAIAAVHVQLAQRAAPYWRLYEQAAASEGEVADEWRLLTSRRRETCAAIAQHIPSNGLQTGLDLTTTTDTIWTLTSPEVYLLLTRDGGHDQPWITAWIARTLCNTLCNTPCNLGLWI